MHREIASCPGAERCAVEVRFARRCRRRAPLAGVRVGEAAHPGPGPEPLTQAELAAVEAHMEGSLTMVTKLLQTAQERTAGATGPESEQVAILKASRVCESAVRTQQ